MNVETAQWAHIAIIVVISIWYIHSRIKVVRGDPWAGIVPALGGLAVLTFSDYIVSGVAPSPYFDSSSQILVAVYFMGLAADAHRLIRKVKPAPEE